MSDMDSTWPEDCPEWTGPEKMLRLVGNVIVVLGVIELLLIWGDVLDLQGGPLLLIGIVAHMQAQQWQSKRILGHAILDLEKRLPDVYLRGWNDAFDKIRHLLGTRFRGIS